jgi:hypothetical protein
MDRVPLNDPANAEKSPNGGDGNSGRRHSWARDHKVALGSLVAVATLGGGFWWRRRRRRIQLEPMSDQWLREREYDAGQREHE